MLANKLMGAAQSGTDDNFKIQLAQFTGTPVNSFYTAGQESAPYDVKFSPDGLNMYIIGGTGDDINQYTLSTAWDITTATFLQLFSVAAQDTIPSALSFSPDGINMYVFGDSSNTHYQYVLSTAWDISTATLVRSRLATAQDTSPDGLFFSPDGLNMYMVGSTDNSVYQYTLSTAWNISTAVYTRAFSFATQTGVAFQVFFSPDGLNMYITAGVGSDVLYQYTLSTAWNISTATFTRSRTFEALTNQIVTAVFFTDDGLTMFQLDNIGFRVVKLTLTTAWDISTAVFTRPSTSFFSVRNRIGNPVDFHISSTGLNMYVLGDDIVYQFTLGTPWQIHTAVYIREFSVAAQETGSNSVFFSPDGLNMYISGTVGDDVNQYTLSTAWDISTAVFTRVFSYAAQSTSSQCLHFSPDGLNMYIDNNSTDNILQYTLSTEWDVSTAVYTRAFSHATETNVVSSVYFDSNGRFMFIADTDSNDRVIKYTLGTPWDISTAVYNTQFQVRQQIADITAVDFKTDGSIMYVLSTSGAMYAYQI